MSSDAKKMKNHKATGLRSFILHNITTLSFLSSLKKWKIADDQETYVDSSEELDNDFISPF